MPVELDPRTGQPERRPGPSDVQARATAAAGRQVDALTAEIARITADKTLSDDDRAKALAILNDDLTGIHTLESDISSATTVKQVRADERTAADSYRVRKVALPEVRWAARIDAVTTTVLPRLQAEQTKLTAALAKHADKSTSALTDALNDLGTQISTAHSDANGVAASALALSPATVAADDQALPRIRAQVKAVEDAIHQVDDLNQRGDDIIRRCAIVGVSSGHTAHDKQRYAEDGATRCRPSLIPHHLPLSSRRVLRKQTAYADHGVEIRSQSRCDTPPKPTPS